MVGYYEFLSGIRWINISSSILDRGWVMRSMADCLQTFFDNLTKEGIDLPTEIQFGRKGYKRLESEINSSRFSNDYKPEIMYYFHGAGTVSITRKLCKECGE